VNFYPTLYPMTCAHEMLRAAYDIEERVATPDGDSYVYGTFRGGCSTNGRPQEPCPLRSESLVMTPSSRPVPAISWVVNWYQTNVVSVAGSGSDL
jgi:hypothetical protein